MIDIQRSRIINIEYIKLLHMLIIAVSSYKACRKNNFIYMKDGIQNFKVIIIQFTPFHKSSGIFLDVFHDEYLLLRNRMVLYKEQICNFVAVNNTILHEESFFNYSEIHHKIASKYADILSFETYFIYNLNHKSVLV